MLQNEIYRPQPEFSTVKEEIMVKKRESAQDFNYSLQYVTFLLPNIWRSFCQFPLTNIIRPEDSAWRNPVRATFVSTKSSILTEKYLFT